MGLMDRLRRGPNVEVEAAPPVVLDEKIRTMQLLVLADALDDLVAAMRADATQRYNPGWKGRIDEYVTAADTARRLRKDGFALEDLHDLAAEVRPVFRPGQEPEPEQAGLVPLQERVMKAVEDVRRVLPQERQAAGPAG